MKSEMFYLYPNHKAIWKLSCLLLSSQDLIWWFDFWMLVLGEYMFLCAYFNLRLSSLRVFFIKKMMDAISSITGCSFQVLSTENSPDFWGKWHEKWLFSSVREWKSLPSLPVSLFPFQLSWDARRDARWHRAAALTVWLQGGDSSLIINPQNLSFFFTLSLVYSLSLQEKYTCILVGKSKWVFVCEIEALPSLCMASALFFPTKKVKTVLYFNCKSILDEFMQIIKGKIHLIGTLHI